MVKKLYIKVKEQSFGILEEIIRISIKLILSAVIVAVFIFLVFLLKELYFWLFPEREDQFINFILSIKAIAAIALFVGSSAYLIFCNIEIWRNAPKKNTSQIDNNKRKQEIIFYDIIRNFLLTSPIDILAFLMITIIASILFFSIFPKYDLFVSLFYFSLLVGCYILYSFLLKPRIFNWRYSRWFYYQESSQDTSEKALKHMRNRIKFMKSADRYLLMRMGELNSILWNNELYLIAIKELIDRGVNIEIIIKNRCDVETKELLKLAIEGKIKIYIASDDVIEMLSKGHFMITDKKGAWIGEPHPTFSKNKRGQYSFGPTCIADEIEKRFKEIKDKCILLDKETIKEINFIIHDAERGYIQADDLERNRLFRYLGIE